MAILTCNGAWLLYGHGVLDSDAPAPPYPQLGPMKVRFQFVDETYDPNGSWYRSGHQWTQVSTSPNVWDYYRNGTDWTFEFGTLTSSQIIRSPAYVIEANLDGITDISYLFAGATNILSAEKFYAPDATTTPHLFDGCINLGYAEILSLESSSSYMYTFARCTSLVDAPYFAFSQNATEAYSMFAGCTSLVNVPLYDTSRIRRFGAVSGESWGMFGGCTSLRTVPLLDMSSAISLDGMFYGCTSLVKVPLFITGSVRSFNSMFANCTSLESIPLFDTHNATNIASMFVNCTSLRAVPLFDTSSCDSTNGRSSSMFSGCVSVERGALDLYKQISTQASYPTTLNRQSMFLNCGANTSSGLAELNQIPTSWGGNMT